MLPTLNDVVDIARQAGGILRSGFGKKHQVEFKGEIDLVTEIDHSSEELILSEIHKRFPGHAILTEESGEHAGSEEHLWYVDPLDGTLNYSHGLPIFCVSIAFSNKQQLSLAVVYDPISNEMFTAAHGKGAQLNSETIKVSSADELKKQFACYRLPI
jgi:myo-inositol-1(or 4)-monophosphatase